MGIRTTVTLDKDVTQRLKQYSKSRGKSFRETLNELLRSALLNAEIQPKRRKLRIKPHHGGYYPGLNYDCAGGLLEYLEEQDHP